METYTVYKHPDSEVDFGRHWGDNPDTGETGWLHSDEIIANSIWEITLRSNEAEATPLMEGSQGSSISDDGKTTSIFLTGGVDGHSYILSNTITTTDNNAIVRQETKSAILHCKALC